jgi:hypothetical protein
MSTTKAVLSGSLVAIALFLPHTVAAQPTPKVQVFGGYSYLRLAEQPNPDFNAENLNGWEASIKLNVTRRLGLLADIGGNYGSLACSPAFVQAAPSLCTVGTNQYTLLVGPEYKVLQLGRMIVNLRVSPGIAHTSNRTGRLTPPFEVKEYWFAASAGGSVDYRISDRLSYRVQPELLMTVGSPFGRQVLPYANLRVSTGFLFGFGRE